jgi:putative membrane protein
MVNETPLSPKRVLFVSGCIGLVACTGLLWLLYGRAMEGPASERLQWLPAFDAFCNGMSALCLMAGYGAIRQRRIPAHMRWMLGAFAFSVLFLAGYITHHAVHGDTKFGGLGLVRPVYFAVLISHVGLSAVALPLILSVLWFAGTGRFSTHRRFARITLPLWLYVSVTGVVVFLFLRAYG